MAELKTMRKFSSHLIKLRGPIHFSSLWWDKKVLTEDQICDKISMTMKNKTLPYSTVFATIKADPDLLWYDSQAIKGLGFSNSPSNTHTIKQQKILLKKFKKKYKNKAYCLVVLNMHRKLN